jgi:hypothetical protein
MKNSARCHLNSESFFIRSENRVADLMKENLSVKNQLNDIQKRLQDFEDSNEKSSERTLEQTIQNINSNTNVSATRQDACSRIAINAPQRLSLEESINCNEHHQQEFGILQKSDISMKLRNLEQILSFACHIPINEESISFFVELPKRLLTHIEGDKGYIPSSPIEADRFVRELAQESAQKYFAMSKEHSEINDELDDCLLEIKNYQDAIKKLLYERKKMQSLGQLNISGGTLETPLAIKESHTSKPKGWLTSNVVSQAGLILQT